MIEVLPAQKYRISELLKQQYKVLNSTAIASGYAGHDPQEGTSDGSFLVSSLLGYKVWLKFFFNSLKEKGKIELKLNQEEDGRLRR